MRILLAQNSLYFPAHGGGDKSNRLLIEALAEHGHECRVVARIPVFGADQEAKYLEALKSRGQEFSAGKGVVRFTRKGVDVRVVTSARLRGYFEEQFEEFRADVTLASTDDPAQVLLEIALRGRVVYLARATLAVPFGPDCAFPSEGLTDRLRRVNRVVGVSQYVADYFRRFAGIDAVHVPISLMEPEDWPDVGRFDSELVTMTNPCAVKGIDIFLALADAFPSVAFAAVPTWGTNERDRAALAARPNVRLLPAVDNIDDLLKRTRVLLVPSLWAEARSRIVLEAMLRGVPVMAADVGGIPEAKMGVPYLLPVRPISGYRQEVDEQMVPIADVPEQDLAPWVEALGRLLTDRTHWEDIARSGREAALEYARKLNAGAFEEILREVAATPASGGPADTRPAGDKERSPALLSEDRKRLLGLMLRKRASGNRWFAGLEMAKSPRLFWFPHAGGGTVVGRGGIVAVRLPGRESRISETPFERMAPLVEALANAIEPYTDEPYAFLGHSMGAAVAFELARELRRRKRPLPRILIASAARAPQFRRNHVPPPAPPDEQLLRELNIPAELERTVLPALRADTALYRNYVYAEDLPFDFPIRAYGGADDPNIRSEHLEGWREQTTGSFVVRVFSGGHFYLQSSAEFRAALEADLA
jgi:surfactin synthase thioesterase subunit/glycosyltransferase involved in cell wall biosynthesis